jgi:hypothetical protein
MAFHFPPEGALEVDSFVQSKLTVDERFHREGHAESSNRTLAVRLDKLRKPCGHEDDRRRIKPMTRAVTAINRPVQAVQK